jgi:hypothetical protein
MAVAYSITSIAKGGIRVLVPMVSGFAVRRANTSDENQDGLLRFSRTLGNASE